MEEVENFIGSPVEDILDLDCVVAKSEIGYEDSANEHIWMSDDKLPLLFPP